VIYTKVGIDRGRFCVLPLREAIAHFARRNTRSSTDTEIGSSDKNGDAHSSIDIAANFLVGFLPLLCNLSEAVLQQDFGFFAEETIRRYHERRKSADVRCSKGMPRDISSFSHVHQSC
jgi:hypothetical protein